jgi:hypothetical protein
MPSGSLAFWADKTRFVDFRNTRPDGTNHPETNGTPFTFLGFTHSGASGGRERMWCGR